MIPKLTFCFYIQVTCGFDGKLEWCWYKNFRYVRCYEPIKCPISKRLMSFIYWGLGSNASWQYLVVLLPRYLAYFNYIETLWMSFWFFEVSEGSDIDCFRTQSFVILIKTLHKKTRVIFIFVSRAYCIWYKSHYTLYQFSCLQFNIQPWFSETNVF